MQPGQRLRRDPLEVRKATLASTLAKAAPGLRLNEHIEADGPTVFARACKMGLEGIVSERQGFDLSVRPITRMDQDEESGLCGGHARSRGGLGAVISRVMQAMDALRSIVVSAALLTLPAEGQDHRFETDPVATVREDFVACDVLSQLQRVMDKARFLLAGECEPLLAGHRVVSRKPRAICLYIYP